MNRDRLTEALGWFDKHRTAVTPHDQAIVAAARMVVAAEPVDICATHVSMMRTDKQCEAVIFRNVALLAHPCRMVRRLLIDPEGSES